MLPVKSTLATAGCELQDREGIPQCPWQKQDWIVLEKLLGKMAHHCEVAAYTGTVDTQPQLIVCPEFTAEWDSCRQAGSLHGQTTRPARWCCLLSTACREMRVTSNSTGTSIAQWNPTIVALLHRLQGQSKELLHLLVCQPVLPGHSGKI